MRSIIFEKHIPKVLLTKAIRPFWSNVVFSPLSPTRLVNTPENALPGARWLRVKNRLCGICASDLHLLFVEADPRISPAALPGTERIHLGHEVLGEVTELGNAVKGLKVGDRVIMNSQGINCLNQEMEPLCRSCQAGKHFLCENASLKPAVIGAGGGWGDGFTAHETDVYRVPDELDDEAAMMMEPLSVGVRTALRRLPKADERCLVVGCGIIGLGVIQALKALSPQCQVTALARYDQQAAMARKLGADDVIRSEDPYAATARITSSKLYRGILKNRMILGGFEVVYDSVGSQRTLHDCLRWARAGGAVVLAGVSLELMRLDLTPIWYQEVDLLGLFAHGIEEWNGVKLSTFDLTAQLLLEGKLTTDGLITHRYPLLQWRQAARTAANKLSGAIKVILDYR